MLLAHPGDFNLPSVRLALSAGEALPPAVHERFKRRFGIEILDGIGSTEALHTFISNRPGAVRPGLDGLLVPGSRLASSTIVAKGSRRARSGTSGSAATRRARPTGTTPEDEGHDRRGVAPDRRQVLPQDAAGYFWYAGRADDMLKVGGLWVSPIEVENALIEHPAVQECGVVGREDRDALVKPAAYVVLRAGVEGTPDLVAELQQCVREKLAAYKRPRSDEFLPELPKTSTGKIQRFRLRT